MTLLGNILWFVLGGWLLFLAYALGALIFFPFFVPIFRVARYACWPLGRTVISQAQLAQYRSLSATPHEVSAARAGMRRASGLLNILWLLSFGWMLALLHFLCVLINISLIWMVVTIPNIAGHWKLMSVALLPFNRVIVADAIAREIEVGVARARLNI
jgi:uncharacterized membrane protein YccF (DUF307 family)